MNHTVVGAMDCGVPGNGVEGKDVRYCWWRGVFTNWAFEAPVITLDLQQKQNVYYKAVILKKNEIRKEKNKLSLLIAQLMVNISNVN